MSQPLDPERWRRLSSVLDAALDLPPEARSRYLDAACQGDESLRRQVEELLQAEAAAGGFLAAPAAERAAPLVVEMMGPLAEASSAEPPPAGRMVGAYRLLGPLGEGGMGTVHLAERADGQFEQQVAIKLLRHGLHSPEAQRRFLLERQILARLEHPAIARLLDGGVTEHGVPFFVMERVEGSPVTTHCRERQLGIADRLRLFLEICDAAQYAHRNLIVHRDLKPSNILVDSAGHVKLLDFGIAKLLADSDDTVPVEATRTLLQALTPEYAAPEQVRGDAITTATDVYSLGVLLYELLTGERPYRVPRGTNVELERAILEQEPARPSARDARLRGDLDWIVLKALQKEPERRYASPEALATDLRRHLAGLPVSARADTLAYRARKFVRRHRLGVVAAGLLLLSLVGGLVGTSWQARRAQREARKAEAVKEFMKSLFAASDPAEAQGKERTARQLLDDGAKRIETELADQPEVQSEVARMIAATYHGLGEYDRALPLLQADLERRRRLDGPRSIAAAETVTQLADLHYDQGHIAEAGPLYEQALAIRREHGERSPEVAELLWDLGGIKRNSDDLAGAEQVDTQALQLYIETKGADSKEATWVRESLAIIYAQAGRAGEAVALEQPVAAWRETHDGPDHPTTLIARYNLTTFLLRVGRLAEAAPIIEDVVERQRRVLGPRHDRLAGSLRTLARIRDAAGQSEEALPPIAEAIGIHREKFGPGHLQVAIDLLNQATIESHTARLAEAERDVRQALALEKKASGTAATDLAAAHWLTGLVLAEVGRLAEADEELSQAVAAFRAQQPSQALALAWALDTLCDVALRLGQPPRAAALGEEAMAILGRSDSKDHPATALARAHAGAALWANGQPGEGENLLREGVTQLQRQFPAGHRDLATAQSLLGAALAGSGRTTEAQPLLQEALRWRQAHLGPADPRTAAVRRLLAPPIR
jgi:serine/threonine-protein kinase